VTTKELWQMAGLDIDNPLNATQASLISGLINLAIAGDLTNTGSLTRQ
jgi:hypothetical protein